MNIFQNYFVTKNNDYATRNATRNKKKYREIGTYTMRVTGLEPARRGH